MNGFPCPECQTGICHKVLDSRKEPNGYIRRRRECNRCSARLTTYELSKRAVKPEQTTKRSGLFCPEVVHSTDAELLRRLLELVHEAQQRES